MALPVAVQVYSVRDSAEKDLRKTLEEIKKIGYDGVEFAGLYGHAPEEVAAMCAQIGLTPISAHVPYAELVEDPKGVLAQYKTVGCRFVAVPYLTEEDRPGTPKFPEVIKNIDMIGAVAKELGIQLLYHNHDFEFLKIDGKYALDILYDSIAPEHLMTELDVCWVRVGGEDPADYIGKYSGRSPVLHLKDYVGDKSEGMYGLIGLEDEAPKRPSNFAFHSVGAGVQDFPSILKAGEAAGAEWVVVEQDEPTEGISRMDCIKMSREYLKTLGY